jgi:Leucine-rich repeat (LRR) protein
MFFQVSRMKAISTLFVALTLLKVSSSQFECDSNNLCFCIQNIDNYEYLCPINYAEEGGFAVTITKDKEIIIDCHNLTSFDVNRLPEVTLHEVNLLYLKFCPFPETGFVPILKWFSIDEIEHLEVEHGIHGNGTLDKRTFVGFRTLSHLKLNRNGLKGLKANVFEPLINLISLELQENTVQLKKNFFNNTPFLELLDISSNNLQSLPEGLFGALEQLESLQLWDNNITELHNYTLRGLVALKVLDLSSNNIQVVSEDTFEELKVLSRLNLGHNNLHWIPPNLFKPVRIIESIKMNDNPKLQLPDYLFSNLTHLHDVDLSNCKLTEIPEHIFENLSGLRVVELQMNNLNHFRSHLFKGLIDLEELYLDDNLIESVENKFASLRGLKILSLRKNLIRTIEIDAFADLIRLEEINLESNEISRIHPYTFHSDTLKKINLSKNLYAGKNKYDPSVLLANTVNIEEVDLSYNLIAQVDDVIDLYNKVLLKNLDLSHNRLTNITVSISHLTRPQLDVTLLAHGIASSIRLVHKSGLQQRDHS